MSNGHVPDEPPSRDEAIRLLTSGYGPSILEAAARYTAPIFWGDPSTDDPDNLQNGSIFFLECGGPVFAVTCDHVVEGWIRARRASPNIVCQIGNQTIEPEARIIDRDEELDLATLSVTRDEVRRLDKWVYGRSASRWPPDPPDLGRGVFFAGFPARYLRRVGPGSLEFGVYAGLGVATRLHRDHIVYQYERDQFVNILGSGMPPPNEWLGGLSGTPLWTVTSFGWRLAGVIYEWSTDYELLYARRPEAIRCDGSLQHFG